VIFVFALVSTANALKGNSWQKRLDRAFLQVDGVTPQGRFRSLERALKDPKLRTDVSKALDVVREKGFGEGHPEFIETLWPEGTQARQDLEGINALTTQFRERGSQIQDNSSFAEGIFQIIRSTQDNLRVSEKGLSPVFSSLVEEVQSDPDRAGRLATNFLRNIPIEVESPSYKVLGQYSVREMVESESNEGNANTEKKSVLTVPCLELRQYEAFRSVSVPVQASGASSSSNQIYTLKNMGSALTEIFSYLELGNNAQSTRMSMTTPFFTHETNGDDIDKMFVKLPASHNGNPPEPVGSSKVTLEKFPETVMAILPFPGICTDEEIKRQKIKLLQRIQMAGEIGWKVKGDENITTSVDLSEIEDGSEESISKIYVLQYNIPGTLPWRRMNEIAIAMEKCT